MRCPHCASPRASPPVCLGCGLPIDAPSEQPILPGLEPTRAVAPEVAVERLPGLETAEEGLRRPPREGEPPARLVCMECGVPNPVSRKKCLACGKRL
jgi:hypothetical protein